MITLQDLFQQAQLAEAAYADLSGITEVTNPEILKTRLINLKPNGSYDFSSAQATAFVTQWQVIDQYTAPPGLFGLTDGTGFSGALFRDRKDGSYVFAVRGTQLGYADLAADVGDIVTDGLAIDQIIEMVNYWRSLTSAGSYQAVRLEDDTVATLALAALKANPATYAAYSAMLATLKSQGAILDSGVLGMTVRRIVAGDSAILLAGTALEYGRNKVSAAVSPSVTGHSLGGHLAAAFSRLFPGIDPKAVTINGAGYPTGLTPGLGGNARSNIANLFSALGGADVFDPARIQNVAGDGPNFVTQNSKLGLVQPGAAPIEIYIESMGPGATFGHGSPQMTDTLAAYALLSRVAGDLAAKPATSTISQLTPILKAASNTANETLESITDAVGKLFLPNYVPLVKNKLIDQREELYKRLDAIAKVVPSNGYTLISLNDKPADQIRAAASQNDATGLAYRYALKELNPFAILGADYGGHKLALVDDASGTGDLSAKWLDDRAAMLTWRLRANSNDIAPIDGTIRFDGARYGYPDTRNWEFSDLAADPASGRTIRIQGSIVGGTNKVVFGSDGADADITGATREDRLYGMAGNDTLRGNGGDDWLEGGTGTDSYVFKSGDGRDAISDSDRNGEIMIDGLAGALTGTTDGVMVDKASNRGVWKDDKGVEYRFISGDLASGGTLRISGAPLGGSGNSIDIKNFKSGDLGIVLTAQRKVALGDQGQANPFGFDPNGATAGIVKNVIEGMGKSLVAFTNTMAQLGDYILVKASDLADKIKAVLGDEIVAFDNGEIRIPLAAGQTQVAFALLSTGDIDVDQSIQLTATFVQANPDPDSPAPESHTITVDVTAIDEGTEPNTATTITGDGVPTDTNPGKDGIQAAGDAFGNPVGEAGAYGDILSGSGGNDHIVSGDANDDVGSDAGDDWLEGGTGSDYLYGEAGNDRIEGGASSDILIGATGDDRLYADGYVETADAIANGANGDGTGQKGDWLAGNEGDDLLVASQGNDVLAGGAGSDRLVGGAGDDDLLGDADYTAQFFRESEKRYSIGSTDWYHSSAATYDWTVTDGPTGRVFAPVVGQTEPPGGAADAIHAGAGNDHVWAGDGDDMVYGESGNDVLVGEAGNDVILGGTGNDTLAGDASYLDARRHGNDFLDGGEGDDTLLGGAGADALFGGAGDDQIVGDDPDNPVDLQGDDYIDGEDGDDILHGAGGADQIMGGAGADKLYGDSANTPDEAQGDDYLDGEDGDDLLVGGGGADTLFGGADNDTLVGDASNVTAAIQGNDYLDGEDGDDTLIGGGGADELFGGAGDDQLFGESDDTPEEAIGDDYLDGEDGNDLLAGAGGADTLFGGKGNDTLFGDSTATPAAKQGADMLDGGEGSDNLYGGGGGDTLIGGAGRDTLIGDDNSVDGQYHGSDTLLGGADADILVGGGGADALYGGDGDDILGGDGDDVVAQYHGDDLLDGGAGNDKLIGHLGNDALLGGDGDDILLGDFGGSSEGGNDTLLGGAGNDQLDGGAGDDVLDGGDGNDVMFAGAGQDTMDGGAGDDVYVVQAGSGAKRIADSGGGNDLLVIQGASFGQTVLRLGSLMIDTGSPGNEIHIDDFDPNDPLSSGSIERFEFDDGIYSYEQLLAKGFEITGTPETDVLTGTALADTIDGLESDDFIDAGAGDDLVTGGDGNDVLLGGDGNDGIDGSDGNDLLVGDDGDDSLDGGAGDDQIYAGAGNDEAFGGDGNDLLLGDDGNDSLVGGSGDDHIDAGAGDNTLLGGDGNDTLLSGDGSDSLDGGVGADSMAGGAGEDTYHVDDAADAIVEAVDEGYDWVVASVDATLADNVEGLDLFYGGVTGTGNALDNAIYGNAGDNVLAGLDGADYIYAAEGNDLVLGGDGADTLDGGEGIDVLEGGAGDDTYYLDDRDDIVIEAADAGYDTVLAWVGVMLADNVERLELLDGYGATGNDLDNVIVGNYLENEIDGGAGADEMIGGWGDDAYYVDNVGDVVIEAADEGWDRVTASIDTTLADNVEGLELLDGALSGTGNALDNALYGNDGNNTLHGLAGSDDIEAAAGDDLLDGGTGADWMAGGAGDDTYLMDDSEDVVIEGPDEGNDTVVASIDATLAENVETLVLVDSATTGYGNTENNTIVGNELANWLDGDGGNDILVGGTGDDTYVLDSVDDAVIEDVGGGHDTVLSSTDATLAANVEDLELIDGAFAGTGNELDNTLTGNYGSNLLQGLGGNDTLVAMGGDDLLLGGEGDDTYLLDQESWYASVLEAADEGRDTVVASISYWLGDNVEDLRLADDTSYDYYLPWLDGYGNELDNTIIGSDGVNNLAGNSGDDIIDGGGSSDGIYGDEGDDHLYGGDDAIREVRYGYYYEDESYYEEVQHYLTDNADELSGGTGNDVIDGGSGDDYLRGDEGDDVLFGGLDGLIGGWVGGDGGEGRQSGIGGTEGGAFLTNNDELDGSEGDDALDGGSGDDRLYGGSGNDVLYGGDDGSLNTSNNDMLDGGEGLDLMRGGTGDDVYYVDGSLEYLPPPPPDEHCGIGTGEDAYVPTVRTIAADTVIENADEGWDMVYSSVGFALPDNVEGLGLMGWDDIDAVGNALDNVLYGNDGSNLIDGGAGADYMDGGWGNDTYVVDDAADQVYEWAPWDVDTVRASIDSYTLGDNLENLDLMGAAGAGYGNDLDNRLRGNALDNQLSGAGGNDILTGAGGNDELYGGEGDDTYVFARGGGQDVIDDTAGFDRLVLVDIEPSEVTLASSGDSLIIGVRGSTDQVTLPGWLGWNSTVQTLEFCDGPSFDRAAIEKSIYNEAPLAQEDVLVLQEDAVVELAGNVLDNDWDPEGDGISYEGPVAEYVGGYGTLTLAADGSYGYVLDNASQAVQALAEGQLVSETFEYRVRDTDIFNPLSSTGPVVVEIYGANDTPLADPDEGGVTVGATQPLTGNVLANDSDIDNGTVLQVADPGDYAGLYGTLSLADDGSYSYALDAGNPALQALGCGNSGVDRFVYTATDGMASASSTLDITVTGSGGGVPVAEPDAAFVIEDLLKSATGNLLANDSSGCGAGTLTLTAPGCRSGEYGSLALAADGGYTYSLHNKSAKVQSLGRDTLVVDHFDYAATNGKADAASTLDVFVQGSNDAPIVVKPLADREVRPGKAFCWQIPQGSFLDVDAGDALAYSATLADGSALPVWLKFDAATLQFSGVAPKKDAALDIRITATDRVAATGNTMGSLSASDVFRLEVDGGCHDHGNEGVGNGEDPPPPGHDHNWNDGPGTWPGHPGSQHGHDRDDRDHNDRHDDGDEGHGRDKERNYFDPSVLADYCTSSDRQHDSGNQASHDEAQTFARWLAAEQAVSRLASEANRGVACLDTARGADIGGLGRATGGLQGGRQSLGDDTISLLPGAGLRGFKGLQEGMRHLG